MGDWKRAGWLKIREPIKVDTVWQLFQIPTNTNNTTIKTEANFIHFNFFGSRYVVVFFFELTLGVLVGGNLCVIAYANVFRKIC